MLSPEDGASAYDGEVDLYTALNSVFKIPVIENEYQKYKVSKVEDYDYKTALGYKTEIESLWAKVKIFMNLIPYSLSRRKISKMERSGLIRIFPEGCHIKQTAKIS